MWSNPSLARALRQQSLAHRRSQFTFTPAPLPRDLERKTPEGTTLKTSGLPTTESDQTTPFVQEARRPAIETNTPIDHNPGRRK